MVGWDMLYGASGKWPVVRCLDCGLARTNPRPAPESLDQVYPDSYRPHRPKRRKKLSIRWRLQQWSLRYHWGYPPKGTSWLGKVASWPIFLWTKYKRRNFDLFPWEGQGRLLDYGCGGGGYLLRMHNRNWQVVGMDFSARAVETCRQQGFEAYEGAAPDDQFAPGHFDVVTLWHVLEHVPSPSRTLRQIHTVLKDGGKLVLAVPNIDSYVARRMGIYWFGLQVPSHVTHFSKGPLTEILRRTGFKVERFYSQNHGQTLGGSVLFMARETDKLRYRILVKSKRLCYLLDQLSRLIGSPGILVVHARKGQLPVKETTGQ